MIFGNEKANLLHFNNILLGETLLYAGDDVICVKGRNA